MDTISPVYARLILREVERRAIDPVGLFIGTSLTRDKLVHGGDIPLADFLHILQAGNRFLGGGHLGFMLGRNTHVFAMGQVGAGMAVAPSLREGLRVLESFNRLHASYVDIRARSTVRGLTVTILYERDTGDVERFHTETAMLLLQQYMETLAGEQVTDTVYRLAIPEPDQRADYVEALHGSISFNAAVNELEIPQRCLDSPSPFYHPELWRQAQMNLSRRLKEKSEIAGTPYTQHVVTLLQTSEPPLPELGEVAFGLHVSERTLNRRLRAEKTSFRKLKADAMASRARLYLRSTDHSVEAIAEELGYRDPGNFRRAFRKSQGCSPIAYRQSQSAANR